MTIFTHYRLSSEILDWMGEVLSEEPYSAVDVRYDCSVTALPDASSENRWVPVLTLYLGIDGVVAGSDIFGVPVIKPYAVNEDFVKDLVRDGMNSLLKTRQELLADLAVPPDDPGQGE